jgi:hypothetical protein
MTRGRRKAGDKRAIRSAPHQHRRHLHYRHHHHRHHHQKQQQTWRSSMARLTSEPARAGQNDVIAPETGESKAPVGRPRARHRPLRAAPASALAVRLGPAPTGEFTTVWQQLRRLVVPPTPPLLLLLLLAGLGWLDVGLVAARIVDSDSDSVIIRSDQGQLFRGLRQAAETGSPEADDVVAFLGKCRRRCAQLARGQLQGHSTPPPDSSAG